jgi:3-hydroxybutyryl-CoA dehydrogenase
MLRLLCSAGKEPVEVGACVGFVANRLQLALFLEALACVEEGVVTAADLDTVVRRTLGVRLPAFGPFAVADMAGLDVYRAILTVLHEQYGDRFAVPPRLARIVDAGRLGVKSGAGIFEYDEQELRDLAPRRDAVYRRLLEATA